MAANFKLMVLAACLVSTSLGAPQLFPFTNLKSYFDQKIKDGPGNDESDAALSEQPSEIVEVPILLKGSFDKPSKQATNHKLIGPDAEASPIVGFHQPFPTQELSAPALGEPVNYAVLLQQAQRPPALPQGLPTVLLPPSQGANIPAAQFLPPVPSQVLQTPPISHGQTYHQPRPETVNVLIKPADDDKPTKTNAKNTNYPKKYKPTPDNHKPISEDSSSDFVQGKKKNYYPKKENYKQSKEQEQHKRNRKQQQNVAATVEAASFQKEVLSKVAAPVFAKDSNKGEQVAAESSFSGISAGAGGHELGLGGGLGGGYSGGGGGDRVEFQMHGQHGPHSYKWGYDTGKGHNRQFRYEERDTHGHVKGHYGFYDKSGKLQVVNYSADPDNGFHADGNYGKHAIA